MRGCNSGLVAAKTLGVSIDFLLDNKAPDQAGEEAVTVAPGKDTAIVITTYDKTQTVSCLSVRYNKIAFPAKNEPPYILQAVDRAGFFGAHSVILGWYEEERTVKKEVEQILSAIEAGQRSYTLQYFTDVKMTALGQASRK